MGPRRRRRDPAVARPSGRRRARALAHRERIAFQRRAARRRHACGGENLAERQRSRLERDRQRPRIRVQRVVRPRGARSLRLRTAHTERTRHRIVGIAHRRLEQRRRGHLHPIAARAGGRAMIRIVIADDHPFILDGLEGVFRNEHDCEIVARATNGDEAFRALEKYRPDILVLDVRMPESDGIDVLRRMQRHSFPTKVVLLTASIDDARLLEAFRLGASGLVLKESAPRLLVQSVRQVMAGEQSWNGKAIAGALRLMLQREQAVAAVSSTLTPRETEVMRMVASGLRNKDIAARLDITEGTVKFHLHSIYEKLHIDGRYALMSYARDHGIC